MTIEESAIGQINVTSIEQSISVHFLDRCGVSIASADFVVDRWWICRVNVKSPSRRKGVGTLLVQRVLAEIAKRPVKRTFVSPGGYGTDPDVLHAFYERCGFRKCAVDLYEWKL